MRFGLHLSVREGYANALDLARAAGCETLQIFSRAPHLWRTQRPDAAEGNAFHARRLALDLRPLVVHTPFMPNLSSRDPKVYARSRRALFEDLDICHTLHADYLVIHPGSYSIGFDAADGIHRMTEAINDALATSADTILLIENMAGGARRLGSTWEELHAMLSGIHKPERVGLCIDTAHLWGAGHPFYAEDEIHQTLEALDHAIGLSRVHALHINDSSAEPGSHLDLHQHIGQGRLSTASFQILTRHPRLQHCAAILETPRTHRGSDAENLVQIRAHAHV